VTSHIGVLLDWTVVDFVVLGFAIQQYVSISRDLKRTKQKEAASQTGHPERQ
jgi:large-conductance mechanosensitive channel